MADSLTFFDAPEPVAIGDLARQIDAELHDASQSDVMVSSVGPIEAAAAGSLSFINNSKYLAAAQETKASAIICSAKHAGLVPSHVAVLVSRDPYKSFAKAMGALFPAGMRPIVQSGETGISSGAFVSESAVLETGVTVEFGAVVGPGAHIGENAHIGVGALVGAGVQIGRETSIGSQANIVHSIVGNRVIIHSGVRVGNDGFGFAMGPGGHLKIPQIGRVIIQDDVEIGANTCIDRGANRDTIVGEGTKIDNLVMIGHNVVIGRHCVIVGQVGIAGSAELGDYVVLGGKAAVNGHIKIGMGAQLAGLSGVSSDVPPGVQWGGVPARPVRHWMREIARLKREAHAMDKRKR